MVLTIKLNQPNVDVFVFLQSDKHWKGTNLLIVGYLRKIDGYELNLIPNDIINMIQMYSISFTWNLI